MLDIGKGKKDLYFLILLNLECQRLVLARLLIGKEKKCLK